MTSSAQKSVFLPNDTASLSQIARRMATANYYQVTVEDFDGCEFQYEVEAESYEDAAAQVEVIAADSFIQVYNMNIYLEL